MNDKVDPLNDADVEVRFGVCQEYVEELEALRLEDELSFNTVVERLKQLVQENKPENSKLVAYAESVLEGLSVDSTSPLSRTELAQALQSDGSFMGADDGIVGIEDAKQNAEDVAAMNRFEASAGEISGDNISNEAL